MDDSQFRFERTWKAIFPPHLQSIPVLDSETECSFCPSERIIEKAWRTIGTCASCSEKGCANHLHKCAVCLCHFCGMCTKEETTLPKNKPIKAGTHVFYLALDNTPSCRIQS